jgi:hypothetical protein
MVSLRLCDPAGDDVLLVIEIYCNSVETAVQGSLFLRVSVPTW